MFVKQNKLHKLKFALQTKLSTDQIVCRIGEKIVEAILEVGNIYQRFIKN